MKYIEVTDQIYKSPNTAVSTHHQNGNWSWEPATPELLSPNLKEWFIHRVLKKHFSFGQPYCVVCGHKKYDQILGSVQ